MADGGKFKTHTHTYKMCSARKSRRLMISIERAFVSSFCALAAKVCVVVVVVVPRGFRYDEDDDEDDLPEQVSSSWLWGENMAAAAVDL